MRARCGVAAAAGGGAVPLVSWLSEEEAPGGVGPAPGAYAKRQPWEAEALPEMGSVSRSWRSVQDQSGRSTLWRALWTSVKGLSKLPNLRDLSSVSLRTQAALAAGKTQEDINTWKASNFHVAPVHYDG